jgi:hypothetical protein
MLKNIKGGRGGTCPLSSTMNECGIINICKKKLK